MSPTWHLTTFSVIQGLTKHRLVRGIDYPYGKQTLATEKRKFQTFTGPLLT